MYHKTASSRTYYQSLRSDLSRAKTEAVISALDRSPVLEILATWPLKEIELSRMESANVSGFYDHLAGKVRVNTIGRWGRSYGEAFSVGKSHRMSKATQDKMESMRRTLLHEIAHHLHEIGGEGVAAVAERSFLDPKSSPISPYATIDPEEYLAESWVAFNVEGNALQTFDPIG